MPIDRLIQSVTPSHSTNSRPVSQSSANRSTRTHPSTHHVDHNRPPNELVDGALCHLPMRQLLVLCSR
ncbi:hypothetical protein BDW75DRAFT_199186 [Aspergillus navahoensis]